MKHKIGPLLLAAALAVLFTFPAFAEGNAGASGWNVVFNGSEMQSNFTTNALQDEILAMQPGDTVTFSVAEKNTATVATDWYMTNEVLKSLEDAQKVANGGGYSYDLRYTDAKGAETVLYTSGAVGGEKSTAAGEGLHEATDSLKNYFFLDTLEPGESGHVDLAVSLDGESQGNAYQNTWAKLQMNFAVELRSSTPTRRIEYSHITPKTGDTTPILIAAICGVAGLSLLAAALFSLRREKKAERSRRV